MFDGHGLQIDMRCVKCGSTGARASLWQMKNHLYICNDCRLREEQRGKVFAWAADVSPPAAAPDVSGQSTIPLPQISVLPPAAEPNIFNVLNLSPEAGREEVIAAIRQSMRDWMARPASDARGAQIELLRTCQERLNNDERYLASERARLRPPEPGGSVLIVGSRPARTIEEFVALCEESSQGWNDGEKHLRSGELEYWTLARTEDRQLARIVRQAMQEQTSDFSALDAVLYRLWPRRPLRLFSSASWQPLQPQDSVTTPGELAAFCDGHWETGLFHLYHGSMLAWLEYAQGCQGLHDWYRQAVQAYEGSGDAYRSLGLELVLEHVVPDLVRPASALTFDGQPEAYHLVAWDNELPHRPVTVALQNSRRGVLLLDITISQEDGAPAWAAVQTGGEVYIRAGDEVAGQATRQILLQDLAHLGYGQTYQCQFQVARKRAHGESPVRSQHTLILTTLPYRQGLRRALWLWGLRGGLPGFAWHALAGTLLALVALGGVQAWAPKALLEDASPPFVQALLSGVTFAVTRAPGEWFVLFAGAGLGCIGALAGFRRGHADYPAREQRAEIWGQGKIWALLLLSGAGLWQYIAFSLPFATSTDPLLLVVRLVAGCLFCTLLLLILLWILMFVRLGLERVLRQEYHALLRPQGGL